MPPLQMTRNVVITAKPRAGHTPPLPRNVFYCPVGRGDPTPPGNRAVDAICRFGCRGEHRSPVRFSQYIVISGRRQRAAYMPPLQRTRYVVVAALCNFTPTYTKSARTAGTPYLFSIIFYLLSKFRLPARTPAGGNGGIRFRRCKSPRLPVGCRSRRIRASFCRRSAR